MEHALISQLDISNIHLLKTFSDALYSASFLSIRCVKSSDGFSFSDESSDPGVHGRRYRPPCCEIRGSCCRVAVEMGAITARLALLGSRLWFSMFRMEDDCLVSRIIFRSMPELKTIANRRLRSCIVPRFEYHYAASHHRSAAPSCACSLSKLSVRFVSVRFVIVRL